MSDKTVNMTVVTEIIKNLEKFTEVSPWTKFHNSIKMNKKLPTNHWKELLQLVKTRDLYKILKEDLTSKECRILGAALTHSKLSHIEDIVDMIISKNDQSTPVLLNFILCKKVKFDLKGVFEYLKVMIKGDIKLVHLELLKTVSEIYPALIDLDILEFCKNNGHDICKQICSTTEMEIV